MILKEYVDVGKLCDLTCKAPCNASQWKIDDEAVKKEIDWVKAFFSHVCKFRYFVVPPVKSETYKDQFSFAWLIYYEFDCTLQIAVIY